MDKLHYLLALFDNEINKLPGVWGNSSDPTNIKALETCKNVLIPIATAARNVMDKGEEMRQVLYRLQEAEIISDK